MTGLVVVTKLVARRAPSQGRPEAIRYEEMGCRSNIGAGIGVGTIAALVNTARPCRPALDSPGSASLIMGES